ncbi:MAG: low molecular weight phosphotyrosine protein phosphatase [Halioglobus sp.]|nr:low molecular weight phosphotyrosine protein phosphatase [Halioglobus sp.]
MPLFQRKQLKNRVLLVCTENICRSPIAEGLLRLYLERSELRDTVEVCSAGTKASRPGCRPDLRAQKVVAYAGINLGRMRARRVTARDFLSSDFVFAMDELNVSDLLEVCPPAHQHKISLLLSHHAGEALIEVPDPYYGTSEGFERVFKILDDAMDDLVGYIRNNID